MNKRIVLSVVSIVFSLTLLAGATFAFFSDVGTSTGNVFAAGVLNLQLDDADEPTPAETVTGSINTTLTPLAPGQSVTGFVSLHNGGSLPIAEVEFAADRTDTGTSTLPGVLHLTSVKTGSNETCTTGDTDHTAAVAAGIADGLAPITLQELIDTSGFDALPALGVGETYFLCLTTTMDATAGDEHQNTSATVDLIFTGHQDASQ